MKLYRCLNPYYNGRYYLRQRTVCYIRTRTEVLILIIMEDTI